MLGAAAGIPQQQQQQQQQSSPAPSPPPPAPRPTYVSESGNWDEDEGEEADADDPAAAGRSPYGARVAAAYSLARSSPAAAERQLAALLAEAPATSAAWFVWAQVAAGSRRPAMARDLFRAAAAAAKAELSAAEAARAPLALSQPMSARLAKVLRVWARMEWDVSLNGAARRLWRAAANEAFRYPRRLAAGVGGVVLHAWAAAEYERDNLRNARIVIGEALRKCSNDTAVNVLGGSIVARGGDVEGARALFLRAYQLDRRERREKQLYIAWPRLEAEAGNAERARVLYQRGLAAHPNSAKLLNVYASFEAKQGNADLARQLHAHALTLDPRSATTMHNRVSWATLELDGGNVEAARQLLREGLDLHPRFGAALVLMARLERQAGDYDLAEAYVRRAYKAGHAFDPAAMGELAAIYEARGEAALAANLRRHLANKIAMRDAKRSGSAWASEAWVRYAEATRSAEQRQVVAAARRRKKELGLIRPRDSSLGGAFGDDWGQAHDAYQPA
ncbi:PsbD mRNA maturation factor Nac2 [Monoraphidium neglectum]|uniref:PsbD mRNA maturation factor Nac2 n=1 Tax=Monoraphidium neglectum TaxID=145388 RepID=A0A0D2J458_9CHLO|nr:PsbD mRNA maturation factor Nac2 [Monoraphidium neglectum]KIY94677.1 PsbD mRNA maturation factor Nac2 [Monoraphidium neglectum]|eukprot:XP_013893697.1 PsbD mRNA maturation factor Nac2 [Monoraphidium neglectum]